MEKPVAKAKITAGKMSITIEDSNWTGDCTITYTLEFDVIDNKNCSSKITLTIKANLSYQDFLKVVVETAKPEAQPMYQNLIYGMYPTNPAPEYGIDPDNEGLNLYVFGQLQSITELPLANKNLQLFNQKSITVNDIAKAGKIVIIGATAAIVVVSLIAFCMYGFPALIAALKAIALSASSISI